MSAEECIEFYNLTLTKIFDTHCPLTTKRYRIDDQRPLWYNSMLQKAKQRKRRAERKYKKVPTDENRAEFNKLRNDYTKKLKQRRNEYFTDKISKSMKDPKTLFKTLNKISGTTKKKILPTYDCNENVSEELSNYYIEKISSIRSRIDSDLKNKSSTNNTNSSYFSPIMFSKFKSISLSDLKIVIKSMKKKSSELDPIPTEMLTDSLDALAPILLHITNKIITQKEFPSILKKAIITPIHS